MENSDTRMAFSPQLAGTYVDLLRYRARSQPEQRSYTFLNDGENEAVHLTYAELDRQSRAIAAMLQCRAAANSRVLLLYAPGLEYIAGFYGCLYAGMVAVPAYPPDPARLERSLPRLLALAADAQASLVLTTSPIYAVAQFIAGQYPEFGRLDWLTVDDQPLHCENDWRPPEIEPDTLAFLQYTSGSTRSPRGVMLSHKNLLHNSQTISDAFEVQETDVGMVWLPPYHDMGLIGGILQPAYAGVHCVMMSPVSFLQRPLRWLQAVSRYGATISGGPNFAYDLCVRKVTPEQKAVLDLSRWSLAFNGAEPVRVETLNNFARAFAPCGFRPQAFYPCYGLAEATLLVTGGRRLANFKSISIDKITLRTSHQVLQTAESGADACIHVGCGQALGCKVEIVGPQSRQPLPSGEIGEVWVAGESIAQGYWNLEDETETVFQARLSDGDRQTYLRTGDLGFLLDGELYITGRIKDLIIIRGRNLYPQDIELSVESCHLALRPGCGAAFSIEEEGDERLVVVQEVAASAAEKPDEIVLLVRQAVSDAHDVQVYDVVLIEPRSIPKTSSGKIQRHACRQAYLNGELAVVHTSKLAARASTHSQPAAAPAGMHTSLESQLGSARQSLLLKALLALGRDERRALLENYVMEQAARLLKQPVSHLELNRPLSTMGLDSVTAVDLISELESGLELTIGLDRFPRDGTPAEVAALLLTRISGGDGSPAEFLADAETAELPAEYPLSYGQRALWFIQQLNPDSAMHNVAAAVSIHSPLDFTALQAAFNRLVRRHPALRTTFGARQGEPYQRVQNHLPPDLHHVDATRWSEDDLQSHMAQEMLKPFDLENGPLVRAVVYDRSSGDYALFLCLHHTITDMWSMAILMAELPLLYQQEVTGMPAQLKPLPYSYAEYASAQHELLQGPEGERLWQYWKEQLGGRLPLLDLPTDHPRPPLQSEQGRAVSLHIEPDLVNKLRQLAQRHETSLFCLTLAAFELLLSRFSGQEEFLVGTLKAGRDRKSTRLLGYFINPIVLRADLTGNPAFTGFLQRVKDNVDSAFRNDAYPFPLLVERLQPQRDLSRTPVFQVLFTWQKTTRMIGQEDMTAFAMGEGGVSTGDASTGALSAGSGRLEIGGLRLEPLALRERVVPFDLTLLLAEASDGLAATLEYNLALFDCATVEGMLQRFKLLLEALAGNPLLPVSRPSMMTAAEEQLVLGDWAGGAEPITARACAHHLIEEEAAREPDSAAIVSRDGELTYHELNRRANQLAHYLSRECGLKLQDRVGVFLERSQDAVVALLAILKAGGVYLPLDPVYPAERLAYMLGDGQGSQYGSVRLVITNDQLAGLIAAPVTQTGVRMVNLDAERSVLLRQPGENPQARTLLDQLAYVLYTSGSTGRPKGVLVSHGALADHCLDIIRHYALTTEDRVLQFASLSFDPSLEQLLPTLIAGARVVLRENELWTPEDLLKFIASHALTVINLPPAYWHQAVQSWSGVREAAFPGSLRLVIIGGDVMQPESVQLWRRVQARTTPLRDVRLLNAYGPTETTITATTFEVNPALPRRQHWDQVAGRRRIPIGCPLPNRRVYVLDRYGSPVPPGIPGELHIGGLSLAEGYLGAGQLSAEKFVPDPFIPPGKRGTAPRMYKTGDQVRFLPDGNLEFLGRVDNQVKVRGFRVELGEIEGAIGQHPAVSEVVVTALQDITGERRLVAYFVPLEAVGVESAGLSEYLKSHLPAYMIPAVFIRLDCLPLNTSGKVDRDALPSPESAGWRAGMDTVRAYTPPRTPIEESLCQIWQQVLRVEHVGVHDNFFELGGHSLMATQVTARTREAFNVELPLQSLFECPTVAGLAVHITAHLAASQPQDELERLLAEVELLSEDDATRMLSAEDSQETS